MALNRQTIQAIQKYGPRVNHLARSKYGVSGKQLLAKLVLGESGGNSNATSYAGAHGLTQFMPGTRQAVLNATGGKVDPYGSPDDAVHAAVIHMKGKLGNAKGLEGYNPGGGQGYVDYILGQGVPGGVTTGHQRGSGHPGASSYGGRSQPTDKDGSRTITHVMPADTSAERALAFAQYAATRKEPGALTELAATIQSLPSFTTSTETIRTPGGQKPGKGNNDGGYGGKPVQTDAKSGYPTLKTSSVGATHETAGLAGYPAHDYMAPAGSAAVAPVSGKVIRFSGHDPSSGPVDGVHGPFGWSLYIQGDDGRTYYLTHMGSRTVSVGQRVKAGQKIGTVGNYGKYGGADHIHMGVSG